MGADTANERPPLLSADELGFTIDGDGQTLPTVALDVSAHPEIADLARVHAVEGVGDVQTTGRRIDDALFVLGIKLTSPVRAAFAIAFVLPDAEAFLRQAGEIGQLVIATTDPDRAATERPLWLAVDLDSDALSTALGG